MVLQVVSLCKTHTHQVNRDHDGDDSPDRSAGEPVDERGLHLADCRPRMRLQPHDFAVCDDADEHAPVQSAQRPAGMKTQASVRSRTSRAQPARLNSTHSDAMKTLSGNLWYSSWRMRTKSTSSDAASEAIVSGSLNERWSALHCSSWYPAYRSSLICMAKCARSTDNLCK